MVNYPADWEITTVEKIADINTGCRNAQDNKPNGRYKFFVRSPIVERIDVADYDCEAVLTAGDGNAGKVFHYVNGKFSAHQRVYIINNFRNVLGRFFYYYFSRNFIKEVRKYTAKSTVDSVRKPMIANMQIPLPPLSEQHAIANTLSVFDNHINNLSELIAKKKAIRDGALNDLMTGRTRLKGFCGAWEVKKLGELFNISAGGDIKKEYFSHIRTSKYQYEIFSNGIENRGLYGYTSKALYPAKSLTVSARGTIGKAFYRDKDFDAIIRLLVLIPKYNNIESKFYEYYINSQIIFESESTGVAQLTAPKIREKKVSLPPLPEQQAIADTLTAFDNEILALESERDKIIQIRDGAMNDLLTGKVRLC